MTSQDKIVITGATGFAGSHVLERFGESKNVIAACRDANKLPSFYQNEAMVGDLHDEEYIETLTSKADVICHTASWAEMNGSVEDSEREYLKPTLRLIDRAMANGVKRFVFLSAITSKPIEEERLHTSLPLKDIWAHYATIMKIEAYLKSVSGQGMDVVVLRVGYFTGKNYALGLLPILLPRLKTHLVPWIEQGKTTLPLIDGADIGLAFTLAATVPLKEHMNVVDIVGKEIPTVREVFDYLHEKHGYPLPHFSVSFGFAYVFARSMRALHKLLPFDPLIVPAVVLLLEETHAHNEKAQKLLGYRPLVDWRESIDVQIAQMLKQQITPMRMNK
jgi:nucleoside-diphosphate-sugar epimerase